MLGEMAEVVVGGGSGGCIKVFILDEFGFNFIQMAVEGKLDLVVGC